MKYYEKKFAIDGDLYIGRFIDSGMDCEFYFEHKDLNTDDNKHFIDKKEVKRLIDAFEDLLYSEEVKKDEN